MTRIFVHTRDWLILKRELLQDEGPAAKLIQNSDVLSYFILAIQNGRRILELRSPFSLQESLS